MIKIADYLKPQIPKMIVQFLIKFGGTIVELLLPWMLSHILDVCAPARDVRTIIFWGIMMSICALLALVGNVTANRMSTRICSNVTKKLRHDLFARTFSLSCAQTDEYTKSSLIARLTSDTYNVHEMLDRMQRLGVRAPILLLGGIAVTAVMEPVLTLVLVGVLPLLLYVVLRVSKGGVPLYTRTQQALDRLVRKVQENMTGVRVIKALSKEGYERARFEEANADVADSEQRAENLMAITNPVMNLMLNCGLTLVIIVGAYRVSLGKTTPGVIIAFLSYFTIILNALMMVTRLFVIYSKGLASAKRIEHVLNSPDDMPVKPECHNEVTAEKNDIREDAYIEFRHVKFSYNKVRNNITDVSFALKRGQTLGIIGPTGSGKTTLLQLLLRFYDADEGEVLLDGRPVSSIGPDEFYRHFGVVFQNDFLFSGGIRDNIDFMRGLSDEKIISATEISQSDFIQEKENTLYSHVAAHGDNLSGGQKQRLLIARAVAADPDILLLDDCSSALDYRTDAALRHALKCSLPDTTKVIVSQRVSSILSADMILVMDRGMVIGTGTHEELMRSCASYRDIYNIQMGEAVS
jgi:ATP-binding cassette subfamily B protein